MEDESGIDLWPASSITLSYLCANLFPSYDATFCESVDNSYLLELQTAFMHLIHIHR